MKEPSTPAARFWLGGVGLPQLAGLTPAPLTGVTVSALGVTLLTADSAETNMVTSICLPFDTRVGIAWMAVM